MREKKPKKREFLRWIKFYCIPSWRDPKFTAIENELNKKRSKRKVFGKMLNPLTVLGTLIILIFIFIAIYVQWLTPYTRFELTKLISTDPGPFSPPTINHPLGTTQNGWDILGRILWGTRTALIIGLSSIAISVVIGTILGVIAAFFGGFIENLIMRISDFILLLPSLILALIIIRLVGTQIIYVVFALSFLGFPGYTRLVRSSVLQVKQNLYVKSAVTSGANNFRVMFKHILPNAISPLIIVTSSSIAYAILSLSSIGFLGLSDPELIDWGYDISASLSRFWSAPFAALWPGLAIGIAAMGFMLLGDGLRDILDPRQN